MSHSSRLNNMATRDKIEIYQNGISSQMPIHHLLVCQDSGERSRALLLKEMQYNDLVKWFRINPEFRILRLTFHRKLASKCSIREIIIASLINFERNAI